MILFVLIASIAIISLIVSPFIFDVGAIKASHYKTIFREYSIQRMDKSKSILVEYVAILPTAPRVGYGELDYLTLKPNKTNIGLTDVINSLMFFLFTYGQINATAPFRVVYGATRM